jgi:hypothetical protein
MTLRRKTGDGTHAGVKSRRIALLGVCAILLQAVLFGWHHHPEYFAVPGQWPILSAQHSGSPLSPATAEDECELCAALHYLTAAPAEFTVAALPPSADLSSPSPLAASPARSLNLSFRARAPPLA